MELISLFFAAAVINNVILSQFLGICPFLGVSKKTSGALGMGAAVMLVLIITSIISWGLSTLLVEQGIVYMDIIVYILVIATTVQLLEMIIKKFFPSMYKTMGVYLPLITTNCAILGTAIVNINNGHTFVELMTYTVGIGVGFALVIWLFSSIRMRLEEAPVPKGFKGIPIALIVATVMAIAFSSLSGMF